MRSVEVYGESVDILHDVIRNDSLNIARIVITKDNVNTPDPISGSLLQVAIEFNRKEMVEHLLNCGANVNYRDHPAGTPLMTAIECENEYMVKRLIDAGANINSTDSTFHETALMRAARRNNVEMVQLLVNAGASTKTTTMWTNETAFDLTENEDILHILRNADK